MKQFFEEPSIDVGKTAKIGGEMRTALRLVGVEHAEEFAKAFTQIGAIFGRLLDKAREAVPREDVGVFGEEAKEKAD